MGISGLPGVAVIGKNERISMKRWIKSLIIIFIVLLPLIIVETIVVIIGDDPSNSEDSDNDFSLNPGEHTWHSFYTGNMRESSWDQYTWIYAEVSNANGPVVFIQIDNYLYREIATQGLEDSIINSQLIENALIVKENVRNSKIHFKVNEFKNITFVVINNGNERVSGNFYVRKEIRYTVLSNVVLASMIMGVLYLFGGVILLCIFIPIFIIKKVRERTTDNPVISDRKEKSLKEVRNE